MSKAGIEFLVSLVVLGVIMIGILLINDLSDKPEKTTAHCECEGCLYFGLKKSDYNVVKKYEGKTWDEPGGILEGEV